MALELEDSQPFLNTLEPSHDSATCRASLEVAIENDSAAEVVKLSNYLLAESTSSSENVLYGVGVYFTSQFCKTQQYSKVRGEQRYCVFVSRVILGNPFMAEGPMTTQKRPAPIPSKGSDPCAPIDSHLQTTCKEECPDKDIAQHSCLV